MAIFLSFSNKRPCSFILQWASQIVASPAAICKMWLPLVGSIWLLQLLSSSSQWRAGERPRNWRRIPLWAPITKLKSHRPKLSHTATSSFEAGWELSLAKQLYTQLKCFYFRRGKWVLGTTCSWPQYSFNWI